jgi:hypothetical protein
MGFLGKIKSMWVEVDQDKDFNQLAKSWTRQVALFLE